MHAPPGSTKPVSFSVLEDYDKGTDLKDVARDFALMNELGVDTWRGSFGWDDYEPAPGRYDFAWLHAFADLAEEYGIALRPYIAYTAPWAAKGGTDDQYWNDPPADLDAWYDFAYHLASAMSRHPNVLSYEIYNEENDPLWWDGTMAEYNAVLGRAAAAIRAADPDAEVILGGFVFAEFEWIESICETHGNASSFDIAALHAYPGTWGPDTLTVENYLDVQYRDYYVPTVQEACEGEPIWINETGYATTPGRTEAQQANWWARAVATFLADPHVEHIGIYEIKDLPPGSAIIGDAANYHLGITRADRTPKLAFHTLDMLTDLLDVGALTIADGELEVAVTSGHAGELYHHLFKRPDGRQVLFAWEKEASPTLDFRLTTPGSTAIEHALDGTSSSYPAFDGRTLRDVPLSPGKVRIFEIRP